MKLCKDCRHATLDRFGFGADAMLCGRTEMFNNVTGIPFYRRCVAERHDSHRIRFFQSNCGSVGRFWEAKLPVPEVPPISGTQFRWETPGSD